MGTRQHKTKGWGIFAVFCAVLFCVAALRACAAKAAPEGCARLMGINMEGPFFSEKKKGAQNGAYLRLPDFEALAHRPHHRRRGVPSRH